MESNMQATNHTKDQKLIQLRKQHAQLCKQKNCRFDIAAAIREKWTVEQYEVEIARLHETAPLSNLDSFL